MSKPTNVNYRKVCQEYYCHSDEEMKNMDVHHKDGDRNNNSPHNLILMTPEEHRDIHNDDFVLWARKGSIAGNAAFMKRLKEVGPTDKELAYRERLKTLLKEKPLHTTPHSEETKRHISEQKREWLKNKKNHPMYGRTTYKVTDPEGTVYIVSDGWKEWCENKNLVASNLRKVALGQRSHHKKWKAEICVNN